MVAVGIVVDLERILSIEECSRVNGTIDEAKLSKKYKDGVFVQLWFSRLGHWPWMHDKAEVGGQSELANDRLSFT